MDEGFNDVMRETERRITPLTHGEQKFYELSIKQEFHETNVKNMLETFKMQAVIMEDSLNQHEQNVEGALEEARKSVAQMRQGILDDLSMTNEEVLSKWREECAKKQEWLKNADAFEADAVKRLEIQMQQIKQKMEGELSKTKQAIDQWGAALGGTIQN